LRIEFQHWRELKAVWREWVDAMLNTRMHILIAGRAGKALVGQTSISGDQRLEQKPPHGVFYQPRIERHLSDNGKQ